MSAKVEAHILETMEDSPTIGEQIRAARKRKGWTQFNLAERIKVSTKTISAIERGVQAPAWDTLSRMANAFGAKIRLVGTEDRLAVLASKLEGQELDIIIGVAEAVLDTLRRPRRKSPSPDGP